MNNEFPEMAKLGGIQELHCNTFCYIEVVLMQLPKKVPKYVQRIAGLGPFALRQANLEMENPLPPTKSHVFCQFPGLTRGFRVSHGDPSGYGPLRTTQGWCPMSHAGATLAPQLLGFTSSTCGSARRVNSCCSPTRCRSRPRKSS